MCGRYALDQNARELAQQFALSEIPELAARYNIPPGTEVLAIIQRGATRVAGSMIWGLEPAWARVRGRPGNSPRPINARSETVASQPMFRTAFRSHRCVLPASGFYEWRRPDRGPKQPFFFRPATGGAFAMAGVFEPGDAVSSPTCCILTRPAYDAVLPVHDRMPVLLSPDQSEHWLRSADLSLLVAAPEDFLLKLPVEPGPPEDPLFKLS